MFVQSSTRILRILFASIDQENDCALIIQKQNLLLDIGGHYPLLVHTGGFRGGAKAHAPAPIQVQEKVIFLKIGCISGEKYGLAPP